MSSLPWYRRFPDNFISGTIGLTLEEKGAYGLVIDLIYVRGGPVPDEARYIAGVCNCSVRKWNTIRARLLALGKLEMVNGCLMNPRAEIELQIAAKASQERAENGSKGGIKSAETRITPNKNNGLEQATLKPARASPLPELFKKEGAIALDPTESTARVDKHIEPELWAVLITLPGHPEPAKWADHWSWPSRLVAEQRALVANRTAA